MTKDNRKNTLEWMARFGYGARGVIYLIIGGLAVLAAVDAGGQTTSSKGALHVVLRQPFGQTLLAMIALGLTGYAVWRFVQAVWDTDGHGRDAKGLTIRAGMLVSSGANLSLAFLAVSLIFGWSTGGGKGTQGWTAWLLSMPLGRWAVGVLGLIVIGVGVAHMVRAWKATFERRLKVDPRRMTWISPVCRFGLVARGVVFLIIGGFLIVAAVEFNSGKARGFQGALNALEQQPYGPWLLAVLALGLFAFGLYGIIEAIYRRIDPPDPTTSPDVE